jgi:hypothetical protein
MTAEVAVLNRIGVALASDSAVSIGREASKICTSADKLFHLSRSAPVGIMIYGNANFVGIPWETVVKEFRRQQGETRYDKLEEYGERFFRFLSRNRMLFPRSAQDEAVASLISDLFLHVRHELQERLTREAERRDGLQGSDIGPIVDEVVTGRLRVIRAQPRLKGFGEAAVAEIRQRYLPTIREERSAIFGKLPITSATSRKISSIASEMLYRYYLGPSRSGVVVAGFGEREAMPVLYGFEVEEMVKDRPRRALTEEHYISPGNGAAIVPFAQQEIVHAFLRGVDGELASHMRDSTARLFEGTLSSILDSIGRVDQTLKDSLDKAVRPEVRNVLKGLFLEWDRQTVSYWGPVVEIVSSLPKDELAAMAEALVNLTKFRRRITPERETVAGPIDVAVISKGDGFVWVRRKHYFDPALNPRVVARYTREG